MIFDEYEIDIIKQTAREIDEVFGDVRKGVPQSKYIIDIPEDEYFCSIDTCYKKVPKDLVGTWMMEHETDLRYTDLEETLDDYWCRCELKTITIDKWVEVE